MGEKPMAQIEGWGNFSAAVQNSSRAKIESISGKANDLQVLNSLATALMQHAGGTRDTLQQLYDRIERLHHKIDRMEKKLSGSPAA
jgi:hypothetical protein